MMSDALPICCDEFESAVATTFANPIDSPFGWLLYGTDYESVSAGHPELRYWPIRYCPFCGMQLELPPRDMLRRSRRFGFDSPPERGAESPS